MLHYSKHCDTCRDCGVLDREGTECPDCDGGQLKRCAECKEQVREDDLVEHHTVDRDGERTRNLCRFCALGCIACGEAEGTTQRPDEWVGWLVCNCCDIKRGPYLLKGIPHDPQSPKSLQSVQACS